MGFSVDFAGRQVELDSMVPRDQTCRKNAPVGKQNYQITYAHVVIFSPTNGQNGNQNLACHITLRVQISRNLFSRFLALSEN